MLFLLLIMTHNTFAAFSVNNKPGNQLHLLFMPFSQFHPQCQNYNISNKTQSNDKSAHKVSDSSTCKASVDGINIFKC